MSEGICGHFGVASQLMQLASFSRCASFHCVVQVDPRSHVNPLELRLFWCARVSPALSAGEIPAPERGRAAPPGSESWAHEGNDMS